MIIHISATEADLDLVAKEKVRGPLKEMLRAHRLGVHLLIASRAVCSWAIKHLEYDNEDTATLRRLYAEYSQTGGLLAQASTYLHIFLGDEKPGPQPNACALNVDEFERLQSLERACLIAENIHTDCVIYKNLIEECALRDGLSIGDIELVHGGGDDISSVLLDRINAGRVIAAVVDGDMKSPNSASSRKTIRCNEIITRSKVPSVAYALECHEIENLVPAFIIERYIAKAKKVVVRKLLKLDKLDSDRQNPYLRYHDFCDGLSLETLNSMARLDREWVAARLASLDVNMNRDYYKGIGKSISKMVRDVAFLNDIRKNFDRIPAFFVMALKRIVWIFVASRPIKT